MLLVVTLLLGPSATWSHGTSATDPMKCRFPLAAEAVAEVRIGDGQGMALQREERQKSVATGNLRVHYDTTGAHAAAFLDAFFRPIPGTSNAYAESVAVIANVVWERQTGSLGYLPPPSDGTAGGGGEYDVYILDLGSLYGSTIPETAIDNGPDGARYTTFIEIDNDFVFVTPPENRGLPALRVTLAHEFHHAVQIGGYGLWQDHIYFYEMTATWMEDVLFDSVDDYLQYLFSPQSQFSQPDVSFTSSTLIMYSRAVWGHFIQKRFGIDLLRTTWEYTRQYNVTPLTAMDLALQQHGSQSTLRTAMAEWVLWNYFTGSRHDPDYYPEGDRYPLMVMTPEEFLTPLDTISGALPPLATRYYSIASAGPMLDLTATNLDLNRAEAGNGTDSEFSYYLSSGRTDAGYEETLSGIFVKAAVDDPFNWHTWAVVNNLPAELGTALPAVAEQIPFPNPFLPGLHQLLNIPLDQDFPLEVELSVFSSDMGLVYSDKLPSTNERGQRVVRWDGKTSSGATAQSGVYFFATSGGGKFAKGKFAVVRSR